MYLSFIVYDASIDNDSFFINHYVTHSFKHFFLFVCENKDSLIPIYSNYNIQ